MSNTNIIPQEILDSLKTQKFIKKSRININNSNSQLNTNDNNGGGHSGIKRNAQILSLSKQNSIKKGINIQQSTVTQINNKQIPTDSMKNSNNQRQVMSQQQSVMNIGQSHNNSINNGQQQQLSQNYDQLQRDISVYNGSYKQNEFIQQSKQDLNQSTKFTPNFRLASQENNINKMNQFHTSHNSSTQNMNQILPQRLNSVQGNYSTNVVQQPISQQNYQRPKTNSPFPHMRTQSQQLKGKKQLLNKIAINSNQSQIVYLNDSMNGVQNFNESGQINAQSQLQNSSQNAIQNKLQQQAQTNFINMIPIIPEQDANCSIALLQLPMQQTSGQQVFMQNNFFIQQYQTSPKGQTQTMLNQEMSNFINCNINQEFSQNDSRSGSPNGILISDYIKQNKADYNQQQQIPSKKQKFQSFDQSGIQTYNHSIPDSQKGNFQESAQSSQTTKNTRIQTHQSSDRKRQLVSQLKEIREMRNRSMSEISQLNQDQEPKQNQQVQVNGNRSSGYSNIAKSGIINAGNLSSNMPNRINRHQRKISQKSFDKFKRDLLSTSHNGGGQAQQTNSNHEILPNNSQKLQQKRSQSTNSHYKDSHNIILQSKDINNFSQFSQNGYLQNIQPMTHENSIVTQQIQGSNFSVEMAKAKPKILKNSNALYKIFNPNQKISGTAMKQIENENMKNRSMDTTNPQYYITFNKDSQNLSNRFNELPASPPIQSQNHDSAHYSFQTNNLSENQQNQQMPNIENNLQNGIENFIPNKFSQKFKSRQIQSINRANSIIKQGLVDTYTSSNNHISSQHYNEIQSNLGSQKSFNIVNNSSIASLPLNSNDINTYAFSPPQRQNFGITNHLSSVNLNDYQNQNSASNLFSTKMLKRNKSRGSSQKLSTQVQNQLKQTDVGKQQYLSQIFWQQNPQQQSLSNINQSTSSTSNISVSGPAQNTQNLQNLSFTSPQIDQIKGKQRRVNQQNYQDSTFLPDLSQNLSQEYIIQGQNYTQNYSQSQNVSPVLQKESNDYQQQQNQRVASFTNNPRPSNFNVIPLKSLKISQQSSQNNNNQFESNQNQANIMPSNYQNTFGTSLKKIRINNKSSQLKKNLTENVNQNQSFDPSPNSNFNNQQQNYQMNQADNFYENNIEETKHQLKFDETYQNNSSHKHNNDQKTATFSQMMYQVSSSIDKNSTNSPKLMQETPRIGSESLQTDKFNYKNMSISLKNLKVQDQQENTIVAVGN